MTSVDRCADETQRLRSQAMAWFVRRRDAGWPAEDEPAFQAWLGADPRHAAAYQRCSDQWSELDAMPGDLLHRMRHLLERDLPTGGRQPAAPSRRRFLAWPAACAMTVSAAGAVGYVAWRHIEDQPVETQALRTERGRQHSAHLSDGSVLRLDTSTSVDVAFYRHRREVRLHDGQAVFEVQPDGRPFHVLAGPVRVTVVGTRFSVRYLPGLPGHAGVQVAVEEGRVRVASLAPPQAQAAGSAARVPQDVLLAAGQRIASDSQGQLGRLDAVSPQGIAPWRERRVVFEDVSLAQALAELERYGPTGLVVRDPKVAALRLSGTFDPMAADALRKVLPRVLPVRLRQANGAVEIVAAN